MANDIPQSPAELREHLSEQLAWLRNSAALYDAGQVHEAKRLAVPIRVLVHDTRLSLSLLKQLGLKGLAFVDTASDAKPGNLISHFGLVVLEKSARGLRYTAMLSDTRRGVGITIPFEAWWTKVVIVDDERQQLTRRDLVLAVANQDGGAHVDPELSEVYAKLSRFNSLGWETPPGPHGAAIPMENPVPACIRQIAHEVLVTLSPERLAGMGRS